MECKNCKAYGIDDINFFGCLIRHEMHDKPNNKVGCYLQEKTIVKKIKEVKENESRANYYKWINE